MAFKYNPLTGEFDYYEPSSGGGGSSAWGDITGTISDQTDLQNALDAKLDANAAITGATKTKITYDINGLVTAGADATQDDIGDGTTYKQYSATEKTKLAGIASGATANSSDAYLLSRANHTGTQLSSTISDFDTAVSANTDVAANTTARHNALTIGTNTATALSLAGQVLSLADKFVLNTGDTMAGDYTIDSGGNANLFFDISGVRKGQVTGEGGAMVLRSENAFYFQSGGGNTRLSITSGGYVGINKFTPTVELHVLGTYMLQDADTATKGYRFRTTGSALDVDFGGADIYLSGFDDAGFTTDQKVYLILNAAEHYADAAGNWIFHDNAFGNNNLTVNKDSELAVNDSGREYDFRVEGDTLPYMIFVDATGTTENIALLTGSAPSWQSMDGGIFIGNVSTTPTGNPTGGGYLYVDAGALKWRGSSGTITTLGAA